MKRFRSVSILMAIIMLFVFSGIGLAADLTLGVGKKGNVYDRVVGKQINVQLKGSQIELSLENFKGSEQIVQAIMSGEIDGGVVQMDSLIGKDFDYQMVAKTHEEFGHLIVLAKGKVKKVGDLLGKKLAIGANGSGAKTTWGNWCDLDEKYKKKVATVPLGGSIALSDLENGKIDGILIIGGLRGGDVMRANKRKKTFRLAKIDDGQFDGLKVKGEKVYTSTKIDDDVYPNLIKGSSVKVVSVPAVVIVSANWVTENEEYYDVLYDAVAAALPNIAQALVND